MLRFLILAALLLPAAYGQTTDEYYGEYTDLFDFALFNAGRPMTLTVKAEPNRYANLYTAVATRLKVAGLFTFSETAAGGGNLHVGMVSVDDGKFFASCGFFKPLTDAFGTSRPIPVPIPYEGCNTPANLSPRAILTPLNTCCCGMWITS